MHENHRSLPNHPETTLPQPPLLPQLRHQRGNLGHNRPGGLLTSMIASLRREKSPDPTNPTWA